MQIIRATALVQLQGTSYYKKKKASLFCPGKGKQSTGKLTKYFRGLINKTQGLSRTAKI